MERIERLVAHIDEGLILAHSDQIARRRLALLLFDSAVELMMYRESQYLLAQEGMTDRLVRRHDQAVKHGYEPSDETERFIEEARGRLTNARKRREIDRYFDAKASFLAEAGLLQDAHARVLKRLHRYRNEAYHEDHLRPHTLDSALRIYILVICSLLINLPVRSIGYRAAKPETPAIVAKYLGRDAEMGFDVHQRLAQVVLERENMTSSLALGEALSSHFIYRLDEFDEGLEFVADWMSDIRTDGPWDRDDVLSLVQIRDDRLAAFANLEEVRAFSAPVLRSRLDEWRMTAQQLGLESDEVAAFVTFADLEDAFEPVEHEVDRAVTAVDGAIQLEVDRRLGK